MCTQCGPIFVTVNIYSMLTDTLPLPSLIHKLQNLQNSKTL